MSTLRAVRESLVEVSRRYSRVAHEVEDLAHDVLLSALRRGTSLDGEGFLRSLHGAARRHGAFLARSAGRRRAREEREAEGARGAREADGSFEHGAAQASAGGGGGDERARGAPLSVLSPALRTTLLLLFQGLQKAELRLALGLTDAALRKRFQALRELGPLARPDVAVVPRTPEISQVRRSQVGLFPQLAAKLVGEGSGRVLATSDPDGHGIFFAEALTPGGATATTGVSASNARTSEEGTPCSTPSSRTSRSSSS